MAKVQITLLFPAYNEQESVGETLREFCRFFPNARFVVVDNNSSDRTAAIAKSTLAALGVEGHVLMEPRQGKAFAVRQALARFKSHIWVIADADSTYPAQDMRELVDLMLERRFDQGIADRLTPKSYKNASGARTIIHRLGNQILTKLVSFVTGSHFRDVLSGGRVLSSPFVSTLEIESSGFELESELNIHASEIDAVTVEKPAEYRQRHAENPSKLSTFRDGWRILRFIGIWTIIKKPDLLFYAGAAVLLVPGAWMAVRVFDIYLTTGAMPYASSAVASSVLMASALQLGLFGTAIKVFRGFRLKGLRREATDLKRQWNSELDDLAKDHQT